MSIEVRPLPEAALLQEHAQSAGYYTDCFAIEFGADVTLEQLIGAFYKTPLFRMERFVLRLAGYGSTDSDVDRLARAEVDEYAAWRLKARAEDQIFLGDKTGQTCSWLAVSKAHVGTVLWFGSSVRARGAPPKLSFMVRAFMPLHVLYSRLLLSAAARRLARDVPVLREV